MIQELIIGEFYTCKDSQAVFIYSGTTPKGNVGILAILGTNWSFHYSEVIITENNYFLKPPVCRRASPIERMALITALKKKDMGYDPTNKELVYTRKYLSHELQKGVVYIPTNCGDNDKWPFVIKAPIKDGAYVLAGINGTNTLTKSTEMHRGHACQRFTIAPKSAVNYFHKKLAEEGLQWNKELNALEPLVESVKDSPKSEFIPGEIYYLPKRNEIVIFKKLEKRTGATNLITVCFYRNNWYCTLGIICSKGYMDDAIPATEEQEKLLLDALRRKGFDYDEVNQKLVKIK